MTTASALRAEESANHRTGTEAVVSCGGGFDRDLADRKAVAADDCEWGRVVHRTDSGFQEEYFMEQSYTQSNESGANVTGLRLLFRLTRSQIKDLRVEGLPEGVEIAKKALFQRGAEATWDFALPESTTVTAIVEYEGEPLVLTDFVWITEGVQDNFLISFAKPVNPLTEGRLANNPLETVIEDPVRLFASRRDAIERTVDPKAKKCQLFYWHYDRETNPGIFPKRKDLPEDEKLKRSSIIRSMVGILTRRVRQRAAFAANGRPPQPGELTPVSDVSWVDYLSKLQLGVIREHLPDGNQGVVDPKALTEAFEMFSNGELRVEVVRRRVWNGEPDSAFEFSFAEFAFVAIEDGIDVDEWSSLLKGLVISQEIFTQAYKPDRPPPFSYTDYRSTNFAPEKQVDIDFKRQLRAEYEGKSVDELADQAGKNALAAFPAEAGRPSG
jgi:hypothetical protein